MHCHASGFCQDASPGGQPVPRDTLLQKLQISLQIFFIFHEHLGLHFFREILQDSWKCFCNLYLCTSAICTITLHNVLIHSKKNSDAEREEWHGSSLNVTVIGDWVH